MGGLVLGGAAIARANKQRKELAPTKCPTCRKTNALEYVKTDKTGSKPITVEVQQQKKSFWNAGEVKTVRMFENTYREYKRCIFCGAITFTDTVLKEFE